MITTIDGITTLDGKDVFKITVVAEAQTDKNGASYWRARYAGKGFTINDEALKDKLVAGEVAEISLVASVYQREDPENAGGTIETPSWAYGGSITYDQLTTAGTKQAAITLAQKRFSLEEKKLDIEGMKLEKEMLASIKLDDAKIKELEAAI